MSGAVILVDGMSIAHRPEVTERIISQFKKDDVEVYDCRAYTPAHLYVRMMADSLDNGKNVIIHNSWYGQYVLNDIGQKTYIPRPMLRMLDRIALGVNAQIAYCTANTRTYARNVESGGYGSYTSMASAIDKMHKAWETMDYHGLQETKIDTSDDMWDSSIDTVVTRAKMFCTTNYGPGIGNWNPGSVVLIVGDRHGPSIQPYQVETNLAFCDMAKAGSSYWLSQQLETAKIKENKLYWINAYDKRGIATPSDFVQLLSPISVIALGDNASKWCEINHIRHEPYYHPQWHKRFQANEAYPMIARLTELVNNI